MEIWQMPATDVARGVQTRAFSAQEATRSVLDRVAEVNPGVNALVEVRETEALAAARRADERLRRGERTGVLHGVPITTKVNTGVTGLPTTEGVAAYADNLATETDPQVAGLLDSGAVLIGRTNCPPFATRWTTESDYYGATLNPWDPAVTPGGSSGGAAAAVATGMGPLAQGNDIGGSIRYPAACCGVVGIRPTPGRVPSWVGPPAGSPPMAVQAFVEQGPLARTVADVRLGLRAMETYDARDPDASFVPSRRPGGGGGRRAAALVTAPGGSGLCGSSTSDSVNAARQAAVWLEQAGYDVEEVELPILGEASRLWWKLALTEFRIDLADEVRRVAEPSYRRFFDSMYEVYQQVFGDVGLEEFVAGWARRGLLRREMSLFMDRFPLVMTPVSGEPPFPMGSDVESTERTAELMARQWPLMSVPVLGLPALAMGVLPTGGAPLGIQIIGRPFDEEAVFGAAEVIEARSGITTPVDPAMSGTRSCRR